MTGDLSPQREAFARGVASGLCQAESYRRAYPRAQNWQAQSVYQQASRLMSDRKVAARVGVLAKAVEAAFVTTTAEVLREAARIAFSDIGRLFNDDGAVRLPRELDVDTARAVASFEITEYGRIKYTFHDKNQALDRLFRHLGLYQAHGVHKSNSVGGPHANHGVKVVRLVALNLDSADGASSSKPIEVAQTDLGE